MTKKKTIQRKTSVKKEKPLAAKKLSYEQKKEIRLKASRAKAAEKAQHGTPANENRFYCTNKQLFDELVKWRDSDKDPEKRKMSEELGKMMIEIGTKVLNRSEFRNYQKEIKEDMMSFGLYKIIRGIKNYDFRFSNPFSFFTTAFFHAYLTVLKKHYKHINIRKDLTEKLLLEMETFPGMNSASSLNKMIKQYLGDDSAD